MNVVPRIGYNSIIITKYLGVLIVEKQVFKSFNLITGLSEIIFLVAFIKLAFVQGY